MIHRRDRIEVELLAFIRRELTEEAHEGIEDPLAADAVDSLGIEQLVDWIEQRFGVRIADTEICVENFGSVAALASLVIAKREAS